MPNRALVVACVIACANLFAVSTPAAAQDYTAEYEELLEDFADSLDDEATARALVERADELYDRIRQYRSDNRKSLPKEQSDALRDLYKEVRSFKYYVRVVAQLGNTADTGIEKFEAVSKQLGLEPRVLQTHAGSGLQLVRLDVGSFGSILVRNPGTTTYTLLYSTNDPKRPGGIGSAACESYSVLSGLFNSRDRDIENIEFVLQPTPISAIKCD